MRLLYLSADPGIPVLGHKGASVHVRALVCALAAKGVSMVVASPRTAPEGERLDAPAELVAIEPVLPKEHGHAASLQTAAERQAAEIVALAREWGAEAVYERYSLFSAGGVRAAATLGLPHVLEVNAPLRDEALRFRGLPHAELAATLEREVFAGTDRVLAVSATLARLLEASGVARARIEVADTGSGIAAEHVHRIYDPFFTTKAARKGTGLGLSVTYGIIQEHGGSIEVSNRRTGGAIFRVELPLAMPGAARKPAAAVSA